MQPRWDARPPVLAAAVWLGTWLGVSEVATGAVVGVLAGCAVGVWWGARNGRLLVAAAGLAIAACLLGGALRSVAAEQGALADLASQRAVVTVEVVLGPGTERTDGRFGPSWWATARVERVDGRGAVWTTGQEVRLVVGGDAVPGWAALGTGSRVRALVRLEPAEPAQPWTAMARAREPPTLLEGPGWADAAADRLRQGLRDASSMLAPEPAALLPALVVGDTSTMPEDLVDRFRTTGLTHLTAVSGANLTLMLASLLWAARRVGVRGWWLRVVAVAGVVSFVVLCRGEPSVLRAAAMGSVGLAGLGLGGSRQGLRYLSWAVIGLLLIDPWLSVSAGFVLSASATAGIVVLAGRWAATLQGWLAAGLAEAFAVSLAAQVATQPIVTAISGQVSLVGLFANLAAAPLVGPATVLGLMGMIVQPAAPWLASAIVWLAGWPVQGLCWIARLGDALPAPVISWPAQPVALGALAGCCVAVALLAGRALGRRGVVLALVVAVLVMMVRPLPTPGWPPPGWEVVACDVGQGSATVIAAGAAGAILVDAGPDPRLLDRCLTGLGVERIALLVVTHLHADHVAGLAGIGGRPVGAVLASTVSHPEEGRRQVEAAAGDSTRFVAEPGLVLAVGAARVEVVSMLAEEAGPAAGEEGESSAENDGSVVVRVESAGLVVLATGDIEVAGQEAALRTGRSVAADVLVVPHHGSSDQVEGFLAAVGAPVALIGVGLDNDYGHPAPTALRRLEVAGSRVFRTDTMGSTAVSRSAAGLTVTTQRDP